jgi:hypothetical protein
MERSREPSRLDFLPHPGLLPAFIPGTRHSGSHTTRSAYDKQRQSVQFILLTIITQVVPKCRSNLVPVDTDCTEVNID